MKYMVVIESPEGQIVKSEIQADTITEAKQIVFGITTYPSGNMSDKTKYADHTFIRAVEI
jgi:hypothetical protein|tara:strand:- start:1604 stop:1783 length:180 start_codon:yes stop_codon:yes gene_type:complete